jgi:hypothetical protein
MLLDGDIELFVVIEELQTDEQIRQLLATHHQAWLGLAWAFKNCYMKTAFTFDTVCPCQAFGWWMHLPTKASEWEKVQKGVAPKNFESSVDRLLGCNRWFFPAHEMSDGIRVRWLSAGKFLLWALSSVLWLKLSIHVWLKIEVPIFSIMSRLCFTR